MIQKPNYTAIRFGMGFAPDAPVARDENALLEQLRLPDYAADMFPVTGFRGRAELALAFVQARLNNRAQKTAAAKERFQETVKSLRNVRQNDQLNTMARSIYGAHGFRERLVMFWADHFTTRAKRTVTEGMVSTYINEAIRPNITGNFGDLVQAAILHPVMLDYLDQSASVGPNSDFGKTKRRGLNENLARELLELHTLGVDGAYTQIDVRQLAELLTGVAGSLKTNLNFNRRRAEPGAETVLGKSYGGWKPKIGDITAVLQDLAVHPDTANHIARKLAVHFITDDPDPDMIAKMTRAFSDTGGNLMAVYQAMLTHDRAWLDFGAKVKRPDEYIFSAIRALDVRPETLLGMNRKNISRLLLGPMALMDQPFQQPRGPDGWPEKAGAWLAPQSLAGRIQWAMAAPRAFRRSNLDPREFVKTALGDVAGKSVLFAAQAAESKWEGIGLILASPDFNRR